MVLVKHLVLYSEVDVYLCHKRAMKGQLEGKGLLLIAMQFLYFCSLAGQLYKCVRTPDGSLFFKKKKFHTL